jgi:DNA-directed RNA polymerase specialized sigma24 family protein
MTVKEAKEELKSYINATDNLERSWERIKRLEARIEFQRVDFSFEKVQTSVRKTFEDKLTELVDLKLDYMRDWVAHEKKVRGIEKRIRTLDEPYQSILMMMYIDGYSLTKTADELCEKRNKDYHYNHVCRLHGTAVKKYSGFF